MPKPTIEVLGVYHLAVTEKMVRDQKEILYGDSLSKREQARAERECRKQLESTVLVEVLIHKRNKRFRVGDFAQGRSGQTEDEWQAAWAEAYLAVDGQSLAVERWADAPAVEPLRVAFFIHFWDSALPLKTSYGDVECPAPRPMPTRLSRLVPYELLD